MAERKRTTVREREGERDNALAILRKGFGLKRGCEVTTLAISHAASGATHRFRVLVVSKDRRIEDVSGLVARAIGCAFDRVGGTLVIRGGGMDMGAEVVFRLSAALFPADGNRAEFALRHRGM